MNGVEAYGYPGKTNSGEFSLFTIRDPKLLAKCEGRLSCESITNLNTKSRNRVLDLMTDENSYKLLLLRTKVTKPADAQP